MSIITKPLIRELRRQFELDWSGIDGAPHWARVRLNGLLIAKTNSARKDVVALFAFLHDSRRFNDGHDPNHGRRAAAYASQLRDEYFVIDDAGFELLQYACIHHSNGESITSPDITVQTCWDGDRLDLGRVGIEPHPARLCTDKAKDPLFLEKAYLRSLGENTHR